MALAYLREQLGPCAPSRLQHALTVNDEPLEGEGPTSLFRFDAAPDGGAPQPFWVAAGETEPNYYPDWGLSADEIYSVHVGTRFMLVMEVTQAPPDRVPAAARQWFTNFLHREMPASRVSGVNVLASFVCENWTHVVAEAIRDGRRVWVVGYDAPPGIYRDSPLPPHVIYRRHMGNVLRGERLPE